MRGGGGGWGRDGRGSGGNGNGGLGGVGKGGRGVTGEDGEDMFYKCGANLYNCLKLFVIIFELLLTFQYSFDVREIL
jgi:hypothetical protein